MSGHTHNNPSNNGRPAFPTSSTDFGLPFGGSTPSAAPSSNTSAFNNAGAASHSFFQSTASSAPISIPSSPSLSLSCNPAASSHHVPLLSLFNGVASSPSKLSTSGTGLGIGNLPSPSTRERGNPLAQTQSSSAFNGQPHSPTLSLAGEALPPPPFAGFASASSSFSSGSVASPAALLRRAQGMNSLGFAIASPARFRRASMLGREITPFHLDNEDRSDEDEQSRSKGKTAAQQADSNRDPDDGDDELMQVEDDEPATASRAPSTPIMGPPLSLFSTPSTPPPASSHLPHTRPSLPSSALARTSASDSGQDSSSSAGAGGLSRTVPRSPSAGPSIGSPLSHAGNRSRSSSLLNSSNVIRKAITRRPNLFPKDRSVARVAVSLQDESKPEDSEIASEAKLQKRLGGEATLPRTPRFGPSGGGATAIGFDSTSRTSRTPLFGASVSGSSGGHARRKYMWDDDVDDIRGVFTADGLDDVDSSGISSEEDEKMMYYSRTDSLSDEEDEMRSRLGQDSNDMQDAPSSCATTGANGDANIHGNNTAGGGSGSAALSTSFGAASASSPGPGSLPKRKNNSLWMGFRDKGHAHKWSPGGSGSASAAGAGSGVFSGERVAWRRAGGTSAGIGMDVDTSPRVLSAAGAGVRLSKRKTMGDDRYEPYKRRAVSPMNLGSSLGTTPTNASLAAAAAAAVANTPTLNAAHTSSAAAGSNSPLMMPISSPSGGILYRGIHHHHHYHAAYASRYSTSPTISRPCTPVNSTSNAGVGAAFSPAGTGSGPGYGSGALGLSISANNLQSLESRVQMEQQQENEALMDQRVGMLGLS